MKYNKHAQQEVTTWNKLHPIGSPVIVCLDTGETRDTVTRSKAQLLAGHTAVIWLKGISGYYRLSQVIPAPADRSTLHAPRSDARTPRRSNAPRYLETLDTPVLSLVPCRD